MPLHDPTVPFNIHAIRGRLLLFFAHLSRLLLRLDQSSAENPVERFRRIELYIRWMEESAAPEAPDSKVATTQLRNLGQNFTPLVSPFLGPGVADSLRF